MANSKVITRNDIQNILAHINLGDDAHREITQAEFNALSQAEKNNGTIYFITDGVSGNAFLEDNVPIGTITPYGGNSDPDYWLICDGRAISRTIYADLFAVIGTTYGTGDGSTTFNIPDLRGNVAVGADTNYTLGATGGAETVTLGTSQIPAHTHGSKSLVGAFAIRKYGNDYNMVPGVSGICTSSSSSSTGQGYATDTINSQYNLQRVQIDASHEHTSVGGSQAHNNMQPYVVTNYIIKASSTLSEHQATVDFFYPVGSYYETSDSAFDPNIELGGTWELTNDYELVAWIVVNNNAIAASKNMTASGLGGTTYYNMSFTKPMKDTNYIVTVSGEASGVGCEIFGIYNKTTTNFYFDHANYSGTQVVVPIFQISVFGRLATPEHFKWHRIA